MRFNPLLRKKKEVFASFVMAEVCSETQTLQTQAEPSYVLHLGFPRLGASCSVMGPFLMF